MSFVPNDVVNLAIGLPILLGSIWLARRGKLIGLLCWPGALFYVLYIYVPYLITVPFSVLFLPYLLLVTLSVYTMIGIVASIDGDAVRQRLTGVVPVRTTGSILTGLAVLIVARQIVVIVTALINQTPADTIELALWIDDFVVGSPALFVGGILLWQRKTLGFVAGTGLLLLCCMLFIGLIPVMVFQALFTDTPVNGVGIVLVLAMSMVCFIPFVFFVRGIASVRSVSSA